MKTKLKIVLFFLVTAAVLGLLAYAAKDATFDILQAKGLIAAQERNLLVYTVLLLLIVAIPVFGLTLFFIWHYRASNTKSEYTPNWEHANIEELIWWAIPFEIILVLGALTWISTHELDPHKPLDVPGQPLKIQVVALDWKWLFIYPEYGIGSVNEVRFPVDREVEFAITSDAPMNSFWIPQLGGQIYAMTGMQTALHLVANTIGVFNGVSANYSGDGFSHMKFKAHAIASKDFEGWVRHVRRSPSLLNEDTYPLLAKPSTTTDVIYYGSVDNDIFEHILMKYMPSTMPMIHLRESNMSSE